MAYNEKDLRKKAEAYLAEQIIFKADVESDLASEIGSRSTIASIQV